MSHITENNILPHLTGKQTLTGVPLDELLALTRQYPAFGAAHFLLAKKAQTENITGKDKYVQAAAIHFANPHWFHFKLNEEELMNMPAAQTAVTQEPPAEDVEEIIIQGLEETLAEEEITAANENLAKPTGDTGAETQAGEAPVAEQPAETPPATEEPTNEETPAVEETIEAPIEGEGYTNSINDEPLPQEDSPAGQPAEEETSPVIDQPAATAVVEEAIPAGEGNPGEAPLEAQTTAEPAVIEHEEPSLEQEIALDEHPAENEVQTGTAFAETQEESEANDTGDFEDADAENEAITPVLNEKISSVLQEQLQEFKKPVAADTPVPIESEPYHTIDYFASQGIRLSAELQKQDHLAVKVKKFTDWLKQMKRINPTPADLGIDAATEHKVQDSAAGSNEAKEVVTEAMAEVLAMQGMKEKAIQVYIKLSFLDPSKTAYFAAKIEQLKGM